MTGAPRNPFEVGKQYRNEHGAYTVVRIDAPDMVIRYANGRTLVSPIALQARIWERICEDEALAAAEKSAGVSAGGQHAAKGVPRVSRLKRGRLRPDVTGTSWRQRLGLGDAGGAAGAGRQPFESHAVYRRPEVYIALPSFYAGRFLPGAKFFFSLNERETFHGFVIEVGQIHGQLLDWRGASMRCCTTVQAQVLVAMQASDLAWEIDTSAPQGDPAHVVRTVTASDETLHLQTDDGEALPLGWPDFVALLEEVPSDRWCDLYLAAHMAKARAIELGVELAQEVAAIYYALLPLYRASVRGRAAAE